MSRSLFSEGMTWAIDHGISGPLLITVVVGILAVAFYVNFIQVDSDFLRDSTKLRSRDQALPAPSEVISLRIYPIKSCRGIEVKQSRLRSTGLDLDRHWMFVDASDMKFLTIRSDPTMTLVDTFIDYDTDELTISIHGKPDEVTIPAHPTTEWLEEHTTLEQVEIWGSQTDGWSYSDKINSLFSKYFAKSVKLIYKGPSSRMSGGNAAKDLYGKEIPHHFADLMSVQIASDSSLRDLNRKLKEHNYDGEDLTIERFRPNIIIRGNEPWEEDRWKEVQITTMDHENQLMWRTVLDVVCRCARCQVPNVNPDTAEKHKHEPWDTMMKFRRVDTGGVAKYKPCFGMLCLPTKEGPISVGAKFETLKVTDKHLYNEAKFSEL